MKTLFSALNEKQLAFPSSYLKSIEMAPRKSTTPEVCNRPKADCDEVHQELDGLKKEMAEDPMTVVHRLIPQLKLKESEEIESLKKKVADLSRELKKVEGDGRESSTTPITGTMKIDQLEKAVKVNPASKSGDAQLKEKCAQLERELAAEKEKSKKIVLGCSKTIQKMIAGVQYAVNDQVGRVRGKIGEDFLLREAEEPEAPAAPAKENTHEKLNRQPNVTQLRAIAKEGAKPAPDVAVSVTVPTGSKRKAATASPTPGAKKTKREAGSGDAGVEENDEDDEDPQDANYEGPTENGSTGSSDGDEQELDDEELAGLEDTSGPLPGQAKKKALSNNKKATLTNMALALLYPPARRSLALYLKYSRSSTVLPQGVTKKGVQDGWRKARKEAHKKADAERVKKYLAMGYDAVSENFYNTDEARKVYSDKKQLATMGAQR